MNQKEKNCDTVAWTIFFNLWKRVLPRAHYHREPSSPSFISYQQEWPIATNQYEKHQGICLQRLQPSVKKERSKFLTVCHQKRSRCYSSRTKACEQTLKCRNIHLPLVVLRRTHGTQIEDEKSYLCGNCKNQKKKVQKYTMVWWIMAGELPSLPIRSKLRQV